MNTHWTEQSIEDFAFRIAADFIVQLEDKMDSTPMSQKELAKRLNVSKSRVSQIFNNPGNLTLEKIVEYSRALQMKVALVAYEDNYPGNDNGPINSDIFRICWEKAGKPRDFWAFEQKADDAVQRVATIPTANATNGLPDPMRLLRVAFDSKTSRANVPADDMTQASTYFSPAAGF